MLLIVQPRDAGPAGAEQGLLGSLPNPTASNPRNTARALCSQTAWIRFSNFVL